MAVIKRIPESAAIIARSLTLNPESMGMNQLNGKFQINNTAFDLKTINYTVSLDNTEIWSIRNMSGIAHPFHIHDVQFNILDRNGSSPEANEMGWKDVVLIKPQETVRFIAKFEHFADTLIPYMYHCHLLTHEDGGMMGQFLVKDLRMLSDIFIPNKVKFKIYPNPASKDAFIDFNKTVNLECISIYDVRGARVYFGDNDNGSKKLSL